MQQYGSVNILQAEYLAKAEGQGSTEKSILDALKLSYETKVKELQEVEVQLVRVLRDLG